MKRLLLFSVLTTFLLTTNAQSQITYVKQGSNGNGSSWANALGSLQAALKKARSGSEIWVAAGIYTPTDHHDRNASFQIPDGVAIYGGFLGHERSRDQRDWTRNRTVLSGEIGDPTSTQDNSYTVVLTRNVSSQTIVDGFVITAGKANEGDAQAGTPQRSGAGWFNDGSYGNSSPTIANCEFFDNYAREGAGLYNYAYQGVCKPSIINCRFAENLAALEGGAMLNNGNSGVCIPRITNCVFIENEAMYGAGITNRGAHGESRPIISESAFTRNLAHIKGGSIFSKTEEKGACGVVLRACVFSENESSLGSGDEISGTVSNMSSQGQSRTRAVIRSYKR